MSHDRGCFKCGADTSAEKRDCYARIGERCAKASIFRLGRPMLPIERYSHHGQSVSVIAAFKGKHREMCLCFRGCDFFKPGEPDNCQIAQANYEVCKTHGLVAPVMECPKFRVADGWA